MERELGPFIDGKPVKEGEPVPVVNPYDGSVVGKVFRGGPELVERAIASAGETFATYPGLPSYRRAEILAQASREIAERSEELSRIIAMEAGKPIAQARGEVARAVKTFSLAAEEATRIGGEILPLDIGSSSEGRVGLVRRYPLGPIGGITPFNFPLNLVAHKVAPALAAGNTIVVKPASATPMSAIVLAEILFSAGLPPGAYNVVPVSAADSERLVTDPRVKLLSFTGSADVGWELKRKAGRKKVCLELGGNAACIVEPDADMDWAVNRIAMGGYAYAGQICISVQRVYVHRSIFQEFVERFVARVGNIVVGDPLYEATETGPMISEAAAARAESWIKEAVDGGARVLVGGRRNGNFFEPTVLTGTRPTDKVVCEEVFAPVVVVEKYGNFQESLEMVNDSRFGLQAGVFTRDINRVMAAFNRLEVGGVIVNDVPTFRVDNYPYGGVKGSGQGREGVRYAIEEMTERRILVMFDSGRPGQKGF